MRQIILDTETTGLEPSLGHRIIEIGCIELIDRRTSGRTFQRYLDPERAVDRGAENVHGLTAEFLARQPRFAAIAAELLAFIAGAELVIHNAPFDVGFLEHEFARLPPPQPVLADLCGVLDTLALARRLHPGQRNSLDALCKRYRVDNSRRELHGALLDARILTDVYLAMTGGQGALTLGAESDAELAASTAAGHGGSAARARLEVPIVRASPAELRAHEQALDTLALAAKGRCLFREAG